MSHGLPQCKPRACMLFKPMFDINLFNDNACLTMKQNKQTNHQNKAKGLFAILVLMQRQIHIREILKTQILTIG